MKKNLFHSSSEFLMIAFATGILLILFIPIPAFLLDILFIANFSWALTILMLAFYTDKPLSFSTFPTLLLISTLFRLGLNVSATRLILSSGDAGHVIEAIGQYVIHDNYVMGLIVFLILIIVQFVVITHGAQRVAEVAARFTLDSMPGKQMSIDADLNMGLISQEDARNRRSQIEKEANFYGAMDGASKFVKGDAIAGILIMLADLIGGFVIGMTQKGLNFLESIHTYSLLTVGDGLITQIPALTISMATGIIVTRAATDARLGAEAAKQMISYPKGLLMVSLSLTGLLFLKGIPVFPVLLMLALFLAAAGYAYSSSKQSESTHNEDNSLYERIKIYPIEILLNPDLFNELNQKETELFSLIEQMRERMAFELGFVLPEVKLRKDKKLNHPFYTIAIQGNHQGHHPLYSDKYLAITPDASSKSPLKGIPVNEPVYGLPALWIAPEDEISAKNSGYKICTPLSVLTSHLYEAIQSHLCELLTRQETEQLLNQNHTRNLSEELIPAHMNVSQVQRILQNLLQEKVSIRPLTTILEVLLEHGKSTPDPIQLTELIRTRLAIPICQQLINNAKSLAVMTLSPALEQKLASFTSTQQLGFSPEVTESFILSLAEQVEKMLAARKKPVLLCSGILRRQIRQLTQRVIPHLTVLGMNEIPVNIPIESFSIVK